MLNLASVTKTLLTLFDAQFRVYGENVGSYQITGAPPGDNSAYGQVSVYLYHLAESPHLRNWTAGGAGPVPVQHTPLGLVLNYIVTAVHKADDPADSVDSEQKWIGYVARTVHDYPVISPDLQIGTTKILNDGMGDNSIELIMRPAPPEETISFWGVGDNNAPRLSLFIEARVALLEPEPPETVMPGMVYSVGPTVIPNMGPQVQGTLSTQAFFPYQGPLQSVACRPARVSAFQGAPSDLLVPSELLSRIPPRLLGKQPLQDNNLLAFECQGGVSGQARLVLESSGRYVDADLGDSANADWKYQLSGTTVTVRVSTRLVGQLSQDPAAASGTFSLIPDVYAASLATVRGGLRLTSTRVPLTVVPQILAVNPNLGALNSFKVTGAFDSSVVRWEPELLIGGIPLTFTTSGSPAAGEFNATIDSASDTTTIMFARPASLNAGVKLMQFMVNHVAAGPLWLEVT